MESFNTLEKVKELFNSVGCEGNENCYFVALKDYKKAKSGVVGGMEYPYSGLLINATEKGLGIFYLNPEKASDIFFKIDVSKLRITENSYFFIPNENIKEIKVKKYSILTSKLKSITIKTNDKKTHQLFANLEESTIPYHKENLAKFASKYEK